MLTSSTMAVTASMTSAASMMASETAIPAEADAATPWPRSMSAATSIAAS